MEKMIEIPEWKLKQIENAIRISLNAYKMRTKETCLFREMCKASEFAKEALAKANTSASGLHIAVVSKNEARVAVGCHTCKHSPHAPFVPKICDECNAETLSEWQPTDC